MAVLRQAAEISPAQTTPARLLFIITKATWGGAQKYVFDLATCASTQGFDVTVAFGTRGELAERLQRAGIRNIELPLMGRDVNLAHDFASFRRLLATIRAENPDIVHLNSSKAGVMGGIAARLARVPRIIFTSHGWAFNESRPFFQRIMIALLQAIGVYMAHVTICVSSAIRNDIRWLPLAGRKLVIIRNGIDVEEIALKERCEARSLLLAGKKDSLWIGMLAELHRNKGLSEAIEAFASVAEAEPGTLLAIIGEGDERPALEQQIRARDLAGRVFLLGHVPDAASYLKALDLFLLTSRTEAFSFALLEAGLAGAPAVCTLVGGIPEIIDDGVTGLLVPKNDIPALARAMLTLVRQPDLRRRLGDALRAHVREHFSKGVMLDKTIALYRAP